MDTPKKILIIQSYNPNKGDNSVVGVMLSSLKKYNYEISLTAFDPTKVEKDYQVKAFDYLFNLRQAKLAANQRIFLCHMMKEGLWLFYSLIWILLYKLKMKLPLPQNKKKIIEAYKNADLIVLPGGHFFTSFNSLINNFSHYYALRYAQLLGKKTMVYAHTIGPYKDNLSGRIEKVLANRVLRRADLVTLRENDSLKNYSGGNVKITAETVFIEPIQHIATDITQYIPQYDGVPIVGVTIHHLYYKHYFVKEYYVKLMVEIFEAILSKYDCRILIIPMEDNYKAGGDRSIIREMISKVQTKYKHKISMVTNDLTSTETANIISCCDMFIGTKTHSIVYGLKTGTPTLAIAYQNKSTEFMKIFGCEANAIDMNQLNLADFMTVFDSIYHNRKSIKQALQQAYPQIREKAEYNNVLLKKLIDA